MAHKSKSPESRTRRIQRLVGQHRKLKSVLRRALAEFQNSNSLVWPFNNVYRPWEGELAAPDQAAAIEWRRMLGTLVEGLRTLFAPWDDGALRDLFPLVEWESGNLASRSSDWVLAAIDRQIESLRTELSGEAVEEQQWTEEVAADSAHRPTSDSQVDGRTQVDIELITVAEAAAMTSLPKWRLYDLCRRQELPGVVRIGRQVRIERKKLLEFIESGGCKREGE